MADKKSDSKPVLSTKIKFLDGKDDGVFSGKVDRYKGIKVQDITEGDFVNKMNRSISFYKAKGLRAIWL
jgi:hypothetical protein